MKISRIEWIDSFRGGLILLIVVGHVIGGAEAAGHINGKFWSGINRIIYMFHVPAFFVLTGFLWKTTEVNAHLLSELKRFAAKKFMRLMVPYFVSGIASVIIYCFVIEKGFESLGAKCLSLLHGGGWGGAFKANFVLWFLPVMFSVTVLYKAIDMLIEWRRTWWAHLLFALGSLYLHRYCVYRLGVDVFPLGFAFAMRYLGYVVLGRLAARIIEASTTTMRERSSATIGIIVFAILAFFDREVCVALVGDWMSWMVMVVVGVLMSLSFMLMLKPLDCGMFRIAGKHSLGIMLMHKFVVVSLESNLMKPFMMWNFCNGAFGVIVVSVMAAAIALFASICICRLCPILLGVPTGR